VDNIKMGLPETGWGGVSSVHLTQKRERWRPLGNTVINFGGSIIFWKVVE
jgi:hypothetical protein